MTKPICSYCRSTWRRSEFHDVCCECGAPMLQAIEFVGNLNIPFMAAAGEMVTVTPRAFRDSDPLSPYWRDGGVSMRADEEIFAAWRW